MRGATGGSEENLLRRSEVYLPKTFIDPPIGYNKPIIIQGHIHSADVIGNIHIIGSPIYCTFGEALIPKYFAEITLFGELSRKDTVEVIETPYSPFRELELDMCGETRDFFEIPKVAEFLNSLDTNKFNIIKFDITINPECNNYGWKKIRERIQETYNCLVKNINPRIVIQRIARSAKQTINLDPKTAVKVWLNKNMKKNPDRARAIYKTSLKYLEVKK